MKKIGLALMLAVGLLFSAEPVGSITGDDDNVTEVCLGFIPEHVKVFSAVENLIYEQYEDMNDTSVILTTGATGVVTYPESAPIVIGVIAQDDGTECYGFSYTNTVTPVIYKATR